MANMSERASQSARYFILMLAYGILAAFTYALSLVLGCDRCTVESIVRYEHMIHVFQSTCFSLLGLSGLTLKFGHP